MIVSDADVNGHCYTLFSIVILCGFQYLNVYCMVQDKDLYYLCDKIKQLRTATFTNFSTALLKFPVNVIEVVATDEEGNLWFRINKPYHCIEDFEQSFPAQLNFYNKDFNYRISAHGKATIAEDTDEIKFKLSFSIESGGQYAIIRFKILSAEYFFNKKRSNNHLKDFINSMIDKILLNEK